MERWLENVAALQQHTPCDFMMVDNTVGTDYLEVVKGYCAKYALTNYKLEHIEIPQGHNADERIGRAREIVRNKVIDGNYDAWFSWECDQIIPVDALDKLINLAQSIVFKGMQLDGYDLVSHNSWGRRSAGVDDTNTDFGVTLIGRRVLEKYSFLLENEKDDPRDCWHGGEEWFRKRILKGGGRYLHVYGVINPIYHLDHDGPENW